MKGLKTISVVDALAASLRDRVLDGDIGSGVGLTEAEISEEYAVSRPTAKTAISLLVQAGLLRREAHKSAYVPRLTGVDVDDLFLVRIPLEVEVVRRVAAAAVPPGAYDAVHDLAAVALDGARSVFVEADLRFHRTLVESIKSPRLSRLYAELSGEIHLLMVQTSHTLGRDRIVGEHAGILDALRAGDADKAAKLMQEHLEGARATLSGQLNS